MSTRRSWPSRASWRDSTRSARKGFGWGIYKIADPSTESPVFRFETNNLMTTGSWGEFGCFGSAANAASAAVDRFIEDNYALLTEGAGANPD